MQFNSKMGYSGNEQDYQLVKASLGKLKLQKELLRYLTNVLPDPTDIVTLDNAQNTVKSVKAQLANKNLLPYPYAETTKTQNGITFTDNGDGSITISGKAEKDAYFRLCTVDFGDKPISAITADSATNAASANKASIATAVQDYGTSDYREIKIGYNGPGLTSSTITHAVGFTDGGTKIKDISKDEFRN